MNKAQVENIGTGAVESNDQNTPLLYQPNQDPITPDGMVSVRFAFLIDKKSCCDCCSCCYDPNKIYINRHQIVMPEKTTVRQFLAYVNEKFGDGKPYTICRVNATYNLSADDPIGPTIKSYEYFESPILILQRLEDQSCCLLI